MEPRSTGEGQQAGKDDPVAEGCAAWALVLFWVALFVIWHVG
jgi:hypothetical protein